MAKKMKANAPLPRRQVVIREHMDLSTNDLQSRATNHRAVETRANAETQRLDVELKNQRSIARTSREDAEALESIIASRR